MAKYKIGAVVAEFNYQVTGLMLERAKAQAEVLDAEITKVLMVPGVYDMPLAVKKMAACEDLDAVITLGAVITGETKHDEVITAQAARKITDLALEYDKPIGYGVTGPGMTEMQAMNRIEKGGEVVTAVVKLLQRFAKL